MNPPELAPVLVPPRVLYYVWIDCDLAPLADPRLQLPQVHSVIHHVLHGLFDIRGLVGYDVVHEANLQGELGVEELLN